MVFWFRHLEDSDLVKPSERFAKQLDLWTENVLPIITLAVACLMVSRIRYAHLFNQLVRGRRPRQHLIQLVFAVPVLFVMPQLSVPLLFCWFAFGAPLRAMWNESVMRWWHRGRVQPAIAGASGVSPPGVEWTSNTPAAMTPPPDNDEMDDA